MMKTELVHTTKIEVQSRRNLAAGKSLANSKGDYIALIDFFTRD